MTHETAAELDNVERPRVHLRALVELVRLESKGLESTGLHEESLPSDQAKGELQ